MGSVGMFLVLYVEIPMRKTTEDTSYILITLCLKCSVEKS